MEGTLDLLILKTIALGPCHGQAWRGRFSAGPKRFFSSNMARFIWPCKRLEDKECISAEWGLSETKRKARFYSLTPTGREQLLEKTSEWQRLTRAMGLILGNSAAPTAEEA